MYRYVNNVSQICSKAAYHIHRIGSTRQYITQNMCRSLVMGLVVSNLDYCNCLSAGLYATQKARLQQLQHRAARLITRTPYSEHITVNTSAKVTSLVASER